MFGFGKKQPVDERQASGEIERVYHEIRQTLRVSGVNLNFRSWAKFDKLLPVVWDTLRPALESVAFERSADNLRRQAAEAANSLGPLNAIQTCPLGPSQQYQIRAALDLYHYINPKLLILTSATKLLIEGATLGNAGSGHKLLERGVPPRMFPMEMVEEDPEEERLKELFRDIQETLSLASVNSDYRTLALWPDYLEASWRKLKVVVQQAEYIRQADQLRTSSRELARALPGPITLSHQALEETGDSIEEFKRETEQFEQLLPGLILNIALCSLDWKSASELEASPFPAANRSASRGAA